MDRRVIDMMQQDVLGSFEKGRTFLSMFDGMLACGNRILSCKGIQGHQISHGQGQSAI